MIARIQYERKLITSAFNPLIACVQTPPPHHPPKKLYYSEAKLNTNHNSHIPWSADYLLIVKLKAPHSTLQIIRTVFIGGFQNIKLRSYASNYSNTRSPTRKVIAWDLEKARRALWSERTRTSGDPLELLHRLCAHIVSKTPPVWRFVKTSSSLGTHRRLVSATARLNFQCSFRFFSIWLPTFFKTFFNQLNFLPLFRREKCNCK